MIATNRNCLQQNEIQQVLAGRLEADAFDSAILHLDNCETCRSAAEKMESDGKWLVDSLGDASVDPLQAETACQVALWRMLQTPQSTHGETSGSKLASAQVPCDFLGPYKLVGTLGSGGMGTVYLAQHERLKRDCAIKLLPRERVDQPGWLDRFDREMTTIASLEHPNIVRATDAGHQDGWHYLVMEHLDGLDVGRVASRMKRLSVADACEIVRQTALGLAHVHDAGLVHRDVKPSNLMLTQKGEVKLLDLGLVLDGDDPLGADDRLTTVGHLMGTMPYMAPEQLADSRDVDQRADLYSLGATLFRLIAGAPPHQRRSTLAAHILAITNEDAPRMDSVREDVDRGVVELAGELLSRDSANRPASASDVANRLETFAAGSRLKGLLRESLRRPHAETSQMSMMPSVAFAGQPPRKRIRRWIWGGLFAAALLLGGFLFKIQTDKGDLVVHSEQDGLTVVVKQDEKVVDRLMIEKGGQNRVVLRKGKYRVEIEGGSKALRLSDEVVTIGRKTQTPIRVEALPSDNADRLFQAKNLDHWISVIQREQDPKALGEAMKAVEILSRNTDRRVEAATSTLRLARELGSFMLGGGGGQFGNGNIEAKPYFMDRFLEVFPAYFPEPGIRLISEELRDGTAESKIACLWEISNFLDGVIGGSEEPGRRDEALRWCANDNKDPKREKLLNDLLQAMSLVTTESPDWSNKYRDSISDMGLSNQLKLLSATGRSFIGDAALEKSIRRSVAMHKADAKKEEEQGGSGGQVAWNGSTLPLSPWVTGLTLVAAAELANAHQADADWEYLAKALVNGSSFLHYQYPTAWDKTFDSIAKHAPKTMVDEIEGQLNTITANSGGGQFGGNPFGQLSGADWTKVIKFYGEHALPNDSSIKLLNTVATKAHASLGQIPNREALVEATLRLQNRMGETAAEAEQPPAMTKKVADVKAVDVPTPERLFQGHPLDHWMSILQREQEPQALGDAIKAVEILSRNTDRRTEAAKSTLLLSRELGGATFGKNDPSQHYMNVLREAFPAYLPEPGIELINAELSEGTVQSKVACLWATHYFLQPFDGMSFDSKKNAEARRWCKNIDKDLAREKLLDSLTQTLAAVTDEMSKSKDELKQMGAYRGINAQMQLSLARFDKVTMSKAIEKHVRDSIAGGKRNIERLRNSLNGTMSAGGFVAPGGSPWATDEVLIAGIALLDPENEGDCRYLAQSMVGNPTYMLDTAMDKAFDELAEKAPKALLDATGERLQAITLNATSSGFRLRDPTNPFAYHSLYGKCLPRAVRFYVETAPSSDESVLLLYDLVSHVARQDGESFESIELVRTIRKKVKAMLDSGQGAIFQAGQKQFETQIKLLEDRLDSDDE